MIWQKTNKESFLTPLIFISLIFTFCLFSFSLFLKEPPVWPDEAIFTDIAKNLNKNAVLATDIFGGLIPGLEKRALWYPPLYFYLLSFWVKFFGESIEAIRLLSFIFSLFSLILFFLITKSLFKNNFLSLTGFLFLIFDVWFFRAAKVARMDMVNFFFLLASFYFLILAKERDKNFLFFLAGLFSGLAILSHPFGLLVFLISLLYLFWEFKKEKQLPKRLFLFLLPVFLCFLIWFLLVKDNLTLFFTQYSLQFLRKKEMAPYLLTLFKNNFLFKLFYSGLFLTIFISFFTLKKSPFFIFFLFSFLIFLFAIIYGKEMWYLLYLQPFLVLIILSLLKRAKELFPKNISLVFYFFVSLVFFLNIFIFFQNFFQIKSAFLNYHQFSKEIAKALPKEGKIFLSVIPDPYFELQKNEKLKLYEFPTVFVNQKDYKRLLSLMDYIVINYPSDKTLFDFVKAKKEKRLVSSGGFSAFIIKVKK